MADGRTVAVVTALEAVLYELSPRDCDLLNALVLIYERGALGAIHQNEPEVWPLMVEQLRRQLDHVVEQIEHRVTADMPVVLARSGRAN